MELFISCVRVSHSQERQQCNVRVFRGSIIMLCFFIDFLWPHVVLNLSTTNCHHIIGIQPLHRPLHDYLLDMYLVQIVFAKNEKKEYVGLMTEDPLWCLSSSLYVTWVLCSNTVNKLKLNGTSYSKLSSTSKLYSLAISWKESKNIYMNQHQVPIFYTFPFFFFFSCL